MENVEIDAGHEPKKNWFVRKVKKYPVISLTVGFLYLGHLFAVCGSYFIDRGYFIENYGSNVWIWGFGLTAFDFLLWALVVYIASKFPKDKLKEKFLRHPLATIVLFGLFVTDLPYRLLEYGGGGGWFETTLFYSFLFFLYWLLVCWISSKIFKKKRFQWVWYRKVIDLAFIIMPVIYKIVFGLILTIIIVFVIFVIMTFVFQYSGQDLQILFS